MDHSYTLIALLQSTFQGKPWYGNSVLTSLSTVSAMKATVRINKSYNIAELVAHMAAWRRYTLAMLTNKYDYSVSPEDNFPEINEITSEKWENLKTQLNELQIKLAEAFENALVNLDINAKVPGKSFTWLDLLYGLIHHDVYHIGQINLIQKFA